MEVRSAYGNWNPTQISSLMAIQHTSGRKRRIAQTKAGPVTIRKPDGTVEVRPAYTPTAVRQIRFGTRHDAPSNTVFGDDSFAPCERCGSLMGIGRIQWGTFLYCSQDPNHFSEKFRENDNRKKRKGRISSVDGA